MPHPAARLNGTVQGKFWANSQCNLRLAAGQCPNCLAGHGLIHFSPPNRKHNAAAAIANFTQFTTDFQFGASPISGGLRNLGRG